MSATDTSPLVECAAPGCATRRRKWDFNDGGHCSRECAARAAGREVLARFRYDHCRCFTCFCQLKEIEPPKPDFEFTERGHGWTRDPETGEPTLEFYNQETTRQAACGFEHLTQHADKGEKNRGERVITGTICRCGATDHTDHDPTLANQTAIDRLVALLDAADDIAIDADTLHRIYASSHDLPLAVGAATED